MLPEKLAERVRRECRADARIHRPCALPPRRGRRSAGWTGRRPPCLSTWRCARSFLSESARRNRWWHRRARRWQSSWNAAFSGSVSSMLPAPERASMAGTGIPGSSSMLPCSVSTVIVWLKRPILISRERVISRTGPTSPLAVNSPMSMLMLPGTASTCSSVLRAPSNCERLGQVLEIQSAGKSAVDGDLPLHVFEREVGALALHVDVALHIHRANGVAVVHFHASVAAQAGQADVAAGAAEIDVAIDIADLEIAAPGAGFHRHGPRHGHFDIVGDALVIGRPILVGADQQVIAFGYDLERRVVVGAVGIVPPKTADRLCCRSPQPPGCPSRSP